MWHGETSRPQERGWWMPLLLVAITLLGAALRVWALGDKGLWIDEAFSVWVARQPLREGVAWLVRIDQHPPLYYALLRLWVRIDDREATVRLLSVLASTLTIPAAYALARRLLARGVAIVTALVLALSPYHVCFAQEARMYALLGLCVTLSSWALACLLTDRCAQRAAGAQLRDAYAAQRGRTGVQPGRVGTDLAWVGYVLSTSAALWTHNVAILHLLTSNAIVAGLWLARRRGCASQGLGVPHLGSWLGAQGAVLALWAPWAPAFVSQSAAVYRSFWLPAPSWRLVGSALAEYLCAFLPLELGRQWAIWAGYGALLIAGVWSLRARHAVRGYLCASACLPIGSALLISAVRPIFYARTLIWTTAPLYMLVVLGILGLRYRAYVIAALTMLVTLNLVALRAYYVGYEKERWDLAASHVAARVEEGDLVLFHATWAQIPFDYYYDRGSGPHVEERGIPVDLFARGVVEPKMTEADLPYLRALVASRRRVWLVYSHHWATDPEGLVPRALGETLRLEFRRRYVGLEVRLYVANAG